MWVCGGNLLLLYEINSSYRVHNGLTKILLSGTRRGVLDRTLCDNVCQ
jgi:hypothetical protein